MVQIKDFGALTDRALVSGHHRIAVIDSDRRGRQFDPQPMANEPRRDTVLIAAHHHLRVAVYARGQGQRGVERLARHGPQQRLLERPIVTNTVGAVSNTSFVVGVIGGRASRGAMR